MICEEMRVPGLPGEKDVTDGSVDYYEMDWVNVDNGVSEEEMGRCQRSTCQQTSACSGNAPEQTDEASYQIVSE